jgi:hypothetical protein
VQVARIGKRKWKGHPVQPRRGHVAVYPSLRQPGKERPAAVVEKIQGSGRLPDAIEGLVEVEGAQPAARDAMTPSFADGECAIGVRKRFWNARTHADIVPELVFCPRPFSTGRIEVRNMAASSTIDAATLRTSVDNAQRE